MSLAAPIRRAWTSAKNSPSARTCPGLAPSGSRATRLEQALPGEIAEQLRRRAGARDRLGDQAVEALDARADDGPLPRELTAVVIDVGARRHDQQRLLPASEMRAHRIHHDLRLAGVRGPGYERDRHDHPSSRTGPTGPSGAGCRVTR